MNIIASPKQTKISCYVKLFTLAKMEEYFKPRMIRRCLCKKTDSSDLFLSANAALYVVDRDCSVGHKAGRYDPVASASQDSTQKASYLSRVSVWSVVPIRSRWGEEKVPRKKGTREKSQSAKTFVIQKRERSVKVVVVRRFNSPFALHPTPSKQPTSTWDFG